MFLLIYLPFVIHLLIAGCLVGCAACKGGCWCEWTCEWTGGLVGEWMVAVVLVGDWGVGWVFDYCLNVFCLLLFISWGAL